MSTGTTRRTYRIVQVTDLRHDDIMKISNTRVGHTEPHANGIAVHWTNGRVGVFHGTEKFGIYR